MNVDYFNIADVIIKISSPFPFVTNNGIDFRCEACAPDFVFRFEQCNDIAGMLENSELIADLMWAHEYKKKDGTYLRAFLWQENLYPIVTVMKENEGICYYAYSDILADKAEKGFELWMYLCLEQILIRHNALVLHSSHIKFEGNGIVFTAPSGTGKSTQAALWEKYANAEIMNGDRSVLRKKDGIWHVYGCPMCGTSNIHKQGSEPLSHIVMLSQGKKNDARMVKGLEAFRFLFKEITIPKWNIPFVDKAMELISNLLETVPMWQYSCTKEEEAVYELQKKICVTR